MYQIRKAKMSDTDAMYQLINKYADEGNLLHRSLSSIYENLPSFYVAESDSKIIGTASLHVLDKDLAEIRSLTVAEEFFGHGIGRELVQKVIEETKELEVKTLLSLTYQVDFFLKCGFKLIDKAQLPMQKVWADCMHCPKFNNCDENAMIITVIE